MGDCRVGPSHGGDDLTAVRPSSFGLSAAVEADDAVVCEVEEDHGTGVLRFDKVVGPQLPSKEEVEEHCLALCPFRHWCKQDIACVVTFVLHMMILTSGRMEYLRFIWTILAWC